MIKASWYLELPGNSPIFDNPRFRKREAQFFELIRTSYGTTKATQPNRLDLVNAAFFPLIEHARTRPYRICDVGVSSGITTVEWLKEFDRHGIPVQMTATDLTMSVALTKLDDHTSVLAELNGHMLQIEFCGVPVLPYMRRRDYVTGAVVAKAALINRVRRAASALLHAKASHCDDISPRMAATRERKMVRLISPVLRDRADVNLVDHDIMSDKPLLPEGSVDVLRIANLLQFSYFKPDQIRSIAAKLKRLCREGSILIICRNAANEIQASILRQNRFGTITVERRLGPGSEVEPFFV